MYHLVFHWQSEPALSYKYKYDWLLVHHKPLVYIHRYTIYSVVKEFEEQQYRIIYVFASLARASAHPLMVPPNNLSRCTRLSLVG